jgi:hypothetical protein
MSEPMVKVRPSPVREGVLVVEMDEAGFDLFRRLLDRAEPRRNDNPKNFAAIKNRIAGAFIAGAHVMGWKG